MFTLIYIVFGLVASVITIVTFVDPKFREKVRKFASKYSMLIIFLLVILSTTFIFFRNPILLYVKQDKPPPPPVPQCLPDLKIKNTKIAQNSIVVNGIASTQPGCPHIKKLQWSWGDNTANEMWFPARHTYKRHGLYTIILTALLSDNKVIQEQETIEIEPTVKPPAKPLPEPPTIPPKVTHKPSKSGLAIYAINRNNPSTDNAYPQLEVLLKRRIAEKTGVHFVSRNNASIVVKLDVHTRRGDTIQGIFVAHGELIIRVIDVANGTELYQKVNTPVKSGGTHYQQAETRAVNLLKEQIATLNINDLIQSIKGKI